MYKKQSILAVIPARLGSKRIKEKNILPIFGKKNLLDFTYNSILKSKYLDRSILSTDSNKIKKIAKNIGFEVPFTRPKKLARDNISSEKVTLHALKKVKENYDYTLILQPTSPLRKATDIDNSIKKIINNNYQCLISIFHSKSKEKYPINLIKKKKTRFSFNSRKRSNYYLNGSIFLFKTNFLYKYKSVDIIQKKGHAMAYKMPDSRSIDIDTNLDLIKFKKLLKKQ